MKTEQGKLVKQAKNILVNLPTKKGNANFPIPQSAVWFNLADATDGADVVVHRDDANRIVKVTLVGKPEMAPQSGQPAGMDRKRDERRSGGFKPTGRSLGGNQPLTARRTMKKARAASLGLEFHNPYTFIGFPERAPNRSEFTLHSELSQHDERYTGIVKLQIHTISPLLSCSPQPVDPEAAHKSYRALCIDQDVVVPSTGIKGALRTLLTILTGGTLGYVNTETFLCQGRDAVLGPRGANSPVGTPQECFMAEVKSPGSTFRDGVVELGDVRLVSLEHLERLDSRLDQYRKPNAKRLWVELNGNGNPNRIHHENPPSGCWQLRLSGRPVNRKGKREALFRSRNVPETLPAHLWADYNARYLHGEHNELRKGDLIWLEPADPDMTTISSGGDVRSIQWSRWGRHGQNLLDLIAEKQPHLLPDSMQTDGLVDEVTNMFGQVSVYRESAVALGDAVKRDFRSASFAGRILAENLVFKDAASKVQTTILAPLAPPHPGCIAFYRDSDDPDGVSANCGLKGYKVYRTTQESGDEAPWLYTTQGVYGEQGELLRSDQKVNKTCDLLPAGFTGELDITFHSLSTRELALLIQACHVPWRLGGGKPLGLGHCQVTVKGLIDELGEKLDFPNWQQHVADIQSRVDLWRASQSPVKRLRYPRAVDDNHHRKSRGGHVWFQRHSQPRMVVAKDGGQPQPGISPLYIGGKLLQQVVAQGESLDTDEPMVQGQLLPALNAAEPQSDVLYGYDGFGVVTERQNRPVRRVFFEYAEFSPEKHVRGSEQSSGNTSQNRESRQQSKDRGKGET